MPDVLTTQAETDESLGHELVQDQQVEAAGTPAPGALELATGSAGGPPAGIDSLPAFPGFDEMRGMASMAVTLAAAAAVPEAMRNKPNDVFLVLLTGRELGVPPTTALRECHVIEGKVTISPKLKLALVRSSGIGRVWKDPASNAKTATWHGVRADDPETTHSSTFTLEDAHRVKDKQGKILAEKPNWQNYPQRMLSWRAAGYLLDDVFSEVGTGLYSPDEMGAMTDEDGKVIDVKAADPLPGTNAPRGHRPPPPEDRASDEDLADIGKRLEAITTRPSARAALLELWHGRDLPAPADLLARQVKVAQAMLKAIEDRIEKGEWADEASEAGVDAGVSDSSGDEQHQSAQGQALAGAKFSQRFAIAAQEAGLDAERRHAVIGHATNGRTRTSKEVLQAEVANCFTVLEQVKDRRFVFAEGEGGTLVLADVPAASPEPAEATAVPVPPPEASEGGSVEEAAQEQSVDPALRALRSSFEDLPEAKRQTVGLQLRAERIKLDAADLTQEQVDRAENLIWEAMTSS